MIELDSIEPNYTKHSYSTLQAAKIREHCIITEKFELDVFV